MADDLARAAPAPAAKVAHIVPEQDAQNQQQEEEADPFENHGGILRHRG
jgi:hypothetical protein